MTAPILLLIAFAWIPSQAMAQTIINASIPAYNPQLNNTLDQGVGPVLYYNGSGDVPALYTLSPIPDPLPALTAAHVEDAIFAEIVAAFTPGTVPGSTNCTRCIDAFEIFHIAALTQSPTVVTDLLILMCNYFHLTVDAATCESEYSGTGGTGPYLAQLFQKMTLATGDMQAFCYYELGYCDVPPVIEIDESQWFSPKPANKTTAPAPSDNTNTMLHTNVDNASVPASRFGEFLCDLTADLGLSAFESMHHFLNLSSISFSLFTGDLVSHDPDDQQSRAFVSYEETVSYHTFKAQLPNIPIYPTLGNHDSIPSGYNAPNNINNGTGATNPMSWNYELLSSLWLQEGWISNSEAQYASTHYGAYAATTKEGLKIISINTDFWYTPNPYNYYNFTNPDNTGILSFLISELTASEALDQRVWIIGHVPSGGGSATTNPTALFVSIVRRFSPATIAGIFFGHTHQDSKTIYYDSLTHNTTGGLTKTTAVNYSAPLSVAWICPSIVPRTNYNSGWAVYEVDTATFEIVNSQTYFANISDSHVWPASGPVWTLEYDTRSTYDPTGTWPAAAPLNATFWDQVTDRMMGDGELVDTYTFLETKKSSQVANCTTNACRESVICTIRSGSAAEAARC